MMHSTGSLLFDDDFEVASVGDARAVRPSESRTRPAGTLGGSTSRDRSSLRVDSAPRSPTRAATAQPSTTTVTTTRMHAEPDRRTDPTRADQIIQHFFAKVTAVVTQARMTGNDDLAGSPAPSSPSAAGKRTGTPSLRRNSGPAARKINKWFNLELPEPELFKNDLRMWKSVSSLHAAATPIPPLHLSVYLDTSALNSSQALVLSDDKGRRSRVHSNVRQRIVLERWTLRLQPPYSLAEPPDLPAVYRLAILFFRTLYTLVRTMPGWTLQRRIGRRASPLQIGVKLAKDDDAHNEIDVDVPIAEDETTTTETTTFPSIFTPNGTLALQCQYRLNTDFSVEDVEALLSSRFINEDYFRPTIGRLQREEEQNRPGSLPSAARPPALHSGSTSPVGRPSYGSLSSRHQLNPPLATSSLSLPGGVNPAAIPLPTGASPDSPSSGRFGSYGVSGSGAAVEPAFVSLSRARQPSFTGPIQRAGSSSAAQPLTGSGSSGSPSFRTGSHFPASSSPASYSPHTGGADGPLSNVYRVPSSSSPRFPSSGSPSPLSYIPRSPLANPYPIASSSTATGARPIPTPSASSTAAGYPSRAYSGGSYPRSYGRGSSGGSLSGDFAPSGWAGPESLGRRTSGRLSFESRYSSSGSPGRTERDDKRFLVSPNIDEDDIKDFVGLIDAKPDYGRSLGASMFASRSQADEALRKLKGSVIEHSSSLESALGPTRLSGIRRQASRLSIEEEPSVDESGRTTTGALPTPRVRRRSLLAQQHSPQPSDSSAPSTARYFSSSSSPRSDASLPQYIPRAHRQSYVSSGVGLYDASSSRHDSPSLLDSGLSDRAGADSDQRLSGGSGSGGASRISPAGGSIQHEGASSSYADDGVDEAVVGRLELSGPEADETDDGRGRATQGVVWHAGRPSVVPTSGSTSNQRSTGSRDRTPGRPFTRDYFTTHGNDWSG